MGAPATPTNQVVGPGVRQVGSDMLVEDGDQAWPTSSTVGIRLAASDFRRRGRAMPMHGSVAMTFSATAARNTERAMTTRVLIVVGANRAGIDVRAGDLRDQPENAPHP